jgi:transcriptional regulator with XRE-family HTH domain
MATDNALEREGAFIPGWTFGDKFRKARRISGLDQRDFATRLNLTASTVAAYEGDRATPRLRDVPQLAKSIQMLTGIEASWFFEFDPVGGPKGHSKDYGSVDSYVEAVITDLHHYQAARRAGISTIAGFVVELTRERPGVA